MSTPPITHTLGYPPVTGGAAVRLWGRDHATYDIACTKGAHRRPPVRHGVPDVISQTIARDGRFEVEAHEFHNGLIGDPAPGHGDVFDTAEEADRARYDAGWLVFEEIVKQYAAAPHRRPRDHVPDDGGDVSEYAAEAAARNMVYGTGR